MADKKEKIQTRYYFELFLLQKAKGKLIGKPRDQLINILKFLLKSYIFREKEDFRK